MRKRALTALAITAVAAVGVAACGSSGSSGSASGSAKAGKTLVVEGTPLSPFTDNFNPFDNSGTGYVVQSTGLINEPLYIYNNMVPTQAPIPMLASGAPTWSSDGKSLTIPIRAGVKWNDGKPFTASDVAFTFNLLKANPKLYTGGAPAVVSATATSPTSVTLTFAQPEIANQFSIAQVYIVPQHVWQSVSDPSTFTDASPVGTGPYKLDKFSPQGFTLKANATYWNKKSVHVPEISFPSYNSNFNLEQPVSTGAIDWAGNDLANIKANFLAKSPQNHTYLAQAPYFADNNVVGLVFNVTKKPLNDPAVRQAISLGINRQQLSVQGETSYEPPATSSGGLMLPTDSSYLTSSLANDLPATGDAAKAASVLTADGWKKVGGKWTKGGQQITFSISDPVPYSDYYTDAQLISHSLDALGMNVTVDGIGDPTTWAADYANGTFDTAIHWSNQGPTPYFVYDGFLDSTLSAPVGQPAAGDNGRYSSPAAQAALAQYEGSTSQSVQAQAIAKLQSIMATEVPVAPLLYGGAWSETSTRNYTGWPTPSNPYMSPEPTSPYLEYTVLHLTPASDEPGRDALAASRDDRVRSPTSGPGQPRPLPGRAGPAITEMATDMTLTPPAATPAGSSPDTGASTLTDAGPGQSAAADTADDSALLAGLSLDAKVALLTGADSWRVPGCPPIGLRPVVTSDGPAGVRGVIKDERAPSTSLPCPSALGASWDPGLVRELALALGREARSKAVDVLLAPTINLMRTPLGGRGFECFSEDPVLTAALATGYVQGVQAAGVAATIKHFVGNDSETRRWTYDARIDEHVLRELYLVPFEAAVRAGGARCVMAAYNSVNGASMTANEPLLRGVLKGEWGFDGVIMSDWHAARHTVSTALAGLDLVMPGPDGPWGARLAAAVADGRVSPEILDDKLLRLLRLARWAGALGEPRPDDPADFGPVPPGLLRRAAAASCTLLRNEAGALPLDPAGLATVTVTGPNAFWPTIQGGGSAGVMPAGRSVPADAIAAALAGTAQVRTAVGCQTWESVPAPPPGSLRDPVGGEPGVRLEFRAGDGSLLAAEHRESSSLTWWDSAPDGVGWGKDGQIVLLASFTAGRTGPHLLGASGIGALTLRLDDEVVISETTRVPEDPVEAMTRPGEVRTQAWLEEGVPVALRLELLPAARGAGPLGVRLGIIPAADEDALLDEAVAAAAASDAAIVIVGSAELTESEGFDRATLALPGRQDELVQRVAAACPRTIVVVNSGMPVLLPWAGQVQAILYAWLPGQEMGQALADVLLGVTEPGGRLPVTLPAAEADCPVLHARPEGDGFLPYSEGLLIGYRGYDAAGTVPRYPFGHGLGYTTWAFETATAAAETLPAGADLDLSVTVRNTGARTGREVIQAYLAGPPEPGRPVRVLAAFGSVTAEPNAPAHLTLRVPARAFARWDTAAATWTWPPARFTIHVGRSAADLPLTIPITLTPPSPPPPPAPAPAGP